MSISLADALVEGLMDLGVSYVFGVSGANIEHLHDALYRQKKHIASIMAKHEAGAAFMADGYARVHGRLGVCCATSGGGMANLLSGLLESQSESVPVLAIIGQPPKSLWGKGAFQDASGIGQTPHARVLLGAMAKGVWEFCDPLSFWDRYAEGIVTLLSGRPGLGVFLISRDCYDLKVPKKPELWAKNIYDAVEQSRVTLSLLQAKNLLEALLLAQKPVLIAGHGVLRSGAEKALLTFCQKIQIPTFTTLSAKGLVPEDSAFYGGVVGACGHPSAHKSVAEADFILAIGTGLSLMNRGPLEPVLQEHTQLYFLNLDTHLKTRYEKAHVYLADIKKSLEILNQIECKPLDCGYKKIQYFKPNPISNEKEMSPSEAIFLLQKIIPKEGHVLFDAGNVAASAMHYMKFPPGVQSSIALGMGGMGYAVGASMGAQMGFSKLLGKRTVVFLGDGAFLMCGLEIHTAIEYNLPILFVVFNNQQHAMCVTRQNLYFEGRIEASTYHPLSATQIVKGLGECFLGEARNPKELQIQMELFLKDSMKPGVLEVYVAANEMPPFTPFLPKETQTAFYEELT